MKKVLLILLIVSCSLLIVNCCNAQDLWGMTENGGANNDGVIFKYLNGTYTKVIDFTGTSGGNTGANPDGSLLHASDGNLYGMTSSGGVNGLSINGYGVLFSINPNPLYHFDTLVNFDGTHGATPVGSLIQASDGNLYGMTVYGGANGYGVIFQYNIATNTYTKEIDFTDTIGAAIGAWPIGSLLQASDGNLYGTTEGGGAYDDVNGGDGVLFQYTLPDSLHPHGTYTKLLDFDGTNGAYPEGTLIQASDGYLYGTTLQGGTGDDAGTIFQFTLPDNINHYGIFKKIRDFSLSNGTYPGQSLIQASDGNLYGITFMGGTSTACSYGCGVLFEYTLPPSVGSYSVKVNFDGTNGAGSYTALMQASDGYLYAIIASNDCGVIDQYNLDGSLINKIDLTGDHGSNPGCVTYNDLNNGVLTEVCTSPAITGNSSVCVGSSNIYSTTAGMSNYQWYINGTAISGATNSSYSVTCNSPGTQTVSVNYLRSSLGCAATTPIVYNVTVDTHPKVDSTERIIVRNQFDTISFHIIPGGQGLFSYQWKLNGNIISGATNSKYTVTSISCTDSGVYSCRVSNACDSVLAKKNYLIVGGCPRYRHIISGYVKYDNADSNVLCTKTTVYLWNSVDTIIDSIATDTNGYYVFANLINGAYKLTCSTTIAWGGVNPVDALLVDRTYVHLSKISDNLRRSAADVNNDGKRNPIDALLIDRRWAHIIKKFTIPDWLFSNPTVIMDGVDITQNIMAICAGDVNGSDDISHGLPDCKPDTTNAIVPDNKSHIFNPQMLANMCKISIDSIVAKPLDTVDLPVRVQRFSPIAVFAFRIRYNTNNIKFLKIANLNPAIPDSTMISYAFRDSINIVWLQPLSDTNSLQLANAKLFDLQFVYKGGTDTLSFTPDCVVADDSLNEINVIYQNGNIGPLYITTQPQNATKCLGDSASFSIAAAGTDSISYRWFKLVAGSWVIESGDTNSKFKIQNLELSDSGTYRCIIFSAYGRVTSDSVTLVVNTPVAITYSSPDTTTCSVPVTLNCFATGTGLSYQWYSSEGAVGYGNDTLITSAADNYYCIVSGACGDTTVYVTFTVNTPVAITYSSPDTTTCSVPVTLNCFATGTGLSYQWYSSEGAVGYGNDTLITSAADNYYCIVSGACGDTTAYVTLTVNTPPDITQQSSDTAVCAGSAATLSVTASGTSPLSYQWYKLEIGSWQQVSGQTNSQFYILHSLLADSGSYMSVVSNVCGNDTSYSVFLTLDTLPVITQQPSGGDMFEGDDFTFSLTATGPSLLYQWYKNSSTISGATNSAYSIQDLLSSDAGKYVCLVNDTCGAVTSDTAILTVNACHRCIHPRQIDNNQTGKTVGNTIDPEVNLYPNPNDGSFTLELKLPSDGNVTLEAYNILGELVQSSVFQFQSPLSIIHYQLSITKGIYFLNIITPTKTFNRKVIIE